MTRTQLMCALSFCLGVGVTPRTVHAQTPEQATASTGKALLGDEELKDLLTGLGFELKTLSKGSQWKAFMVANGDVDPSTFYFDDKQKKLYNSAADTSSWRTYTNTKFGFEFKYPGHWREANTTTDKANTIWINFSSPSGGATRNVLYVEVFSDPHAFAVQETLLAGNATATPVTVDRTTQHLYADFLDIPTALIAKNDLLMEMGDPSHEGYLKQILATFRFLE